MRLFFYIQELSNLKHRGKVYANFNQLIDDVFGINSV